MVPTCWKESIKIICLLVILLHETLIAEAQPKTDNPSKALTPLKPGSEKRERFLGDFALGFAKFGSGGIGGLGGIYGHGQHHHHHQGFGYGGFQHGIGLGGYHHGYNPYYYRPPIFGGFGGYIGGSSYFKQHYHHHGYHQHHHSLGYPGYFNGGGGLGLGGIAFH